MLRDAIEAFDKVSAYTNLSRWGGVEDLFVLSSGVLGWVSVAVCARTVGAAGPVLLLFALPSWMGAIGGGFAVAAALLACSCDGMWEMMTYSLVSVVGVSILRVYLSNIL